MPIKKVKKATGTKKILKSLKKLDQKKIATGHFSSQGNHASGMAYVDIMALWAIGGPNMDTIKNPRAILGESFRDRVNKPEFKASIRRYVKNLSSEMSDEEFLNSVGEFIAAEYKSLFGKLDAALMQGSPSNPSNPLLDTGELRSKVIYKIMNEGG